MERLREEIEKGKSEYEALVEEEEVHFTRSWSLVKKGLLMELLSLFICLLLGFLVGLAYEPFRRYWTTIKQKWPGLDFSSFLIFFGAQASLKIRRGCICL